MLVLGCSVGLVTAALGVGGGILMVPAFVTFLPGMDMNTAKGSSLFIILLVTSYNSWRMNRGETKNPWDTAFLVVIGSIVGGYIGGWVTGLLADATVAWIFVGLVGFATIRTIFLTGHGVPEEEVQKRRALSIAIGLGSGIVAGATGTGGGAILVPLALWSGIASNERVVALSNVVMAATCAAGALAHVFSAQTLDTAWTYGLVNFSLAPLIFIGAIAAAPMGHWINARLTLPLRKVAMSLLLITLGARLVFRALGS